MTRSSRVVFFLCAWAALGSPPADPGPRTPWNDYLRSLESRLEKEVTSGFLWIDRLPGGCERVRAGEVVTAMVDRRQVEPHGLIHDWVGAVFVPGARLDGMLSVVHNYARYSHYYGPTIRDSKLLSQDGDTLHVQMRYARSALWVTVVVDVDYDIRFRNLDQRRAYSTARSTCVQEISNFGRPGERKLPCGDPHAYIWSAYGVSKYEERDGGVYVEEERVVLTPEIPAAFRWLVEPVVNRLSRELVAMSLRRTRDAATVAASQTD